MKYILYCINLKTGKLKERYRHNLNDAIEMFYDEDPVNRFGYIDRDEDSLCINEGQGWMASDDGYDYETEEEDITIYVILFKDEPGIFEHFMKYCKEPDIVRRIVNRYQNLEKLLED